MSNVVLYDGSGNVISSSNPLNVQLAGSYPANATPWSSTGVSANNMAKTLTEAAPGEGKYHYITAIEVVIYGASAGAAIDVYLQDDAAGTPTNYWHEVIGNSSLVGTRVGITFPLPIKLGANKTADLVVDAVGTAGGYAVLNMAGYSL